MHHAHRLGFHLFRPNEESLLELCFAVGNLWRSIPSPTPNLCHLRSLLCSFICLCSYSLTSSLRFEKEKKNLFLWWQWPHGASRPSDLTDKAPLFRQKVRHANTHAHTERNLFDRLQAHLAITQEKVACSSRRGSGVFHSILCTQFNFSGLHLLSSHDTTVSFTVNKRRDNRGITERGSEYQQWYIYFFFFSFCDTDLEDREKEHKI